MSVARWDVPFVEASVLHYVISSDALRRGDIGTARAISGASLLQRDCFAELAGKSLR